MVITPTASTSRTCVTAVRVGNADAVHHVLTEDRPRHRIRWYSNMLRRVHWSTPQLRD